MSSVIKSSNSSETQILLTIKHNDSMLSFEDQLQAELNAAGKLAECKQLENLDTDGSPIFIGNVKMTSKKKKQLKVYETPYGPVDVSRYVYQSSKGGSTYSPLDHNARIVVNSTPKFAQMVSWKYAEMAAPQVQKDFEQNHKRLTSRATLRDIADVVGAIAQSKEDLWTYSIPELPAPVATVSIGLDGAIMLYHEGYREAMCGSITLYDAAGNRMFSSYCAEAPEYGKSSFIERFTREIHKVKKQFPEATYVGVADGAPDNWIFLKPFVDECILDFYHVSEYISEAADALYAGKTKKNKRKKWYRETLHNLKHNQGEAECLNQILQKSEPSNHYPTTIAKLEKVKTYFKNHWHQMGYAQALENHYPIGSGVTEAACKTLIKSRMCRSGMRWKEEGASMLLTLRALVCSTGVWDKFWAKISNYGFPLMHNT